MHIGYKNSSVLLQQFAQLPPFSRNPNARPPSPTDCPALIRSAHGGSPMNAQMRSAHGGIRYNRCKKIKPQIESNMVATQTRSAMLRRCSKVAASRQRRPVTLAIPMTAPSDPVCVEEGGADGIDATTPTSKPIASMPPDPTRCHRGHLLVVVAGPRKP
jgi:hypothetical protein